MSRKIKYIDGHMFEYEILKLVDIHDPILRTPTKPIDFNQMGPREIEFNALSLMETLSEMDGLGLSANQVGLPYRMFALNMGNKVWGLINPVVVDKSILKSSYQEGCLSYPGLFLKLERAQSITVKFNAIAGEEITQTFDGLTATCVQHELDHLDGILYTDLVHPFHLMRAKRKIKGNLKKMARVGNEALLK